MPQIRPNVHDELIVRSGRSRSSKVVELAAIERVLCNFLLVINSNLCPISCQKFSGFLLKTATVSREIVDVPLKPDCRFGPPRATIL